VTYLDTAHRNIAWFNTQFREGRLDMHPPFQRNPVWTTPQKSYLMDTILRGLPVPELYMQDVVDEHGKEKYIVVDGQQRIRSCLEFIDGEYTLNSDDSPEWGAATFDELSREDKQKFFAYKFVVRTLPEMPEEELRGIFTRLNKNVVALNAQELRHATYWGPFIKYVEAEAEKNPFWEDSGIFSTNDFRRMLDVEFVSELVVAYLHGFQHKKAKLDHYYQIYEDGGFEAREDVEGVFFRTTGEVLAILPEIRKSRWRKKSDFYTLFLVMAASSEQFPLPREDRVAAREKLVAFDEKVSEFLKIDLDSAEDVENWPSDVRRYGVAVERAASDLTNRKARHEVLSAVLADALRG
jgi:Protein of unknown function DUF262